MSKLIQCGDHQWAPWSIVCKHLVSGESADWCPVAAEEDGEVEHDWLCPSCLANHPNHDVDDLKAICIHCVRILRGKAHAR